jgi:hypothetical protein
MYTLQATLRNQWKKEVKAIDSAITGPSEES